MMNVISNLLPSSNWSVIPVVNPPSDHPKREDILAGQVCFAAQGVAINSGEFDGQSTEEVKIAITEQLTSNGTGCAAVNYKLRDWLFFEAEILG